MNDEETNHRRWRLPRTFSALRHRNYRLFYGGQMVSLTGSWMQQTALAWITYDITHSAFLLGLISAVGSLPMFFFSIPGGVLADRMEKRRIIIFTQTTAMILAFILTALTAFDVIQAWHIALLAACSGTVLAFDMPARQAFVVEMVGKEELMNAIALNSTIFNSARIFGPAIAGALVASVGPSWCFFINGLSFLAVIAGLFLMRFPEHVGGTRSGSMLQEALSGFRYLRSNRTVLNIATMLGIFFIFGWYYAVLLPVFAKDILDVGAPGLGYLMTASGVGALFGALTVATLSAYPHKRRLFFGGAILLAAASEGFAFSRIFSLSAVLLALVGFGGITVMATANTMIQLSVSDDMRGRIMGVWALVFAGTTPISSFLAGTLAQHFGAPFAVALGAGIMGLVVSGAALAAWRARGGRMKDEG
jgi:MFS family permease